LNYRDMKQYRARWTIKAWTRRDSEIRCLLFES